MKKWKVLKKEDVSPSKWFPVEKHTVELSDGTVIDDFYISPMKNAAMIFPITTKNEIVLVKQYKHAVGEILIELPAGFQQEGKTLEETALAELEEETGIKATKDNLIFLGKTVSNPTKITQTIYCYIARNLEFNSKQNLEVTEEIEIIKVTPLKALEMVKKGEIWAADSVANIARAYLKFPEIFSA